MGKFILIAILAFAAGFFFFTRQAAPKEELSGPSLSIKGNVLEVEVMKTQEEQIRGLSGRELLAENTGMLFVYDKPVIPGFWMKDMNFSIDIIWIGEDRSIVDITENLAPETYPITFSPASPVQYVLEVNAGWAQEHSIEIGDSIEFDGIF